MKEDKASYRQIFKATSIYGGVQLFNIVVGIIKSKAAAIFIGADGMGIVGLFNSAIDLVRSITGLGINLSAVREISKTNSENNSIQLGGLVLTVKKLCWLTGALGMLIVILLAPYLSQQTFGNKEYTNSFLFLSIVPLLTSLSMGQLAVLQGLRKIEYLAKSNLYGGLCGLVFLIPFYWFLGTKGIVPFIIVSAAISLCFSFYFANKLTIEKVKYTHKEVYSEGKRIISLGVMLTLSSLAVMLKGYLLRIFILDNGGYTEVGLYSAAFLLIDTYTGLIFTAMGTDFFPRLSVINKDNRKMENLINCQVELGVLILAPLIMIFMVFAPFLLTLLYSKKFVPATDMLQWAMLGIILKASSWPLVFSLLAKANNKIFLVTEIASCTYALVFSILGYKLWGFMGLGIGFSSAYVCNLLQMSIINKVLYNIKLRFSYYEIFTPQLFLCISVLVVVQLIENPIFVYLLGGILILLSSIISYRELDKRIDIKNLLMTKLKRK